MSLFKTAVISFTLMLSASNVLPAFSVSESLLPLEYQNVELKKLVGSDNSIDKEQLKVILSDLVAHGTLSLRRYSSGGHSAVTIAEPKNLESAIDGMLIMHWDRDNVMQALAEYQLSEDEALRTRLKVPKDAWRKGLFASIKHHSMYKSRFIDIIEGKAGAHDYTKRPHIRYNPISLSEVPDQWGHAQNDAMGYLLFMLFYTANESKVELNAEEKNAMTDFAVMVPKFFEKIEAWKDFDYGAWEDKKAEHASSIGCVLAGLREEKKYVDKHGAFTKAFDGKTYTVDGTLLAKLIKECETKLAEILPNEFIRSDKEDKRADASVDRNADAALINALFLGALSGQPLVDETTQEKVLQSTILHLARPIGFARYPFDIWDGRVDRKDLKPNLEEAQWSHVAPMMSVIYGDMYRRTKKKIYLDWQVLFFKRAMTTVNSRWRIPEAYIVDPKTRAWVSDANEPLAWAQAVTIMAIVSMEKSLNLENEAK